MPNEQGSLRIYSGRSGTVAEVTSYLQDLESAYDKIYLFYQMMGIFNRESPSFRSWGLYWHEFSAFPFPLLSLEASPEYILPDDKLIIGRIQIESPGFWEFLGSLNPLQQIREYLNDRHRRRQDREYREQLERNRLALENELIQRQVWEMENSILHDRITVMREMGFSDEEIRSLVWVNVGRPLIVLAKHQDTGLIENAE
jgi:hypothetical protein